MGASGLTGSDLAMLANVILKPNSYNVAEKPEWRDGTYNFKPIRPEGATYEKPQGFEGLLGKLQK